MQARSLWNIGCRLLCVVAFGWLCAAQPPPFGRNTLAPSIVSNDPAPLPVAASSVPERYIPSSPAAANAADVLNAASDLRGGGASSAPADTSYILYTVRTGDALSVIANRYGVKVSTLVALNGLRSPDAIYIGQKLRIPVTSGGGAQPAAVAQPKEGPGDKIIADSEVVYSPAYDGFNVEALAKLYGGHLATYKERVEGELLTGPQIIQIVSERFSIGPRVLLAALELRSGWVSGEPETARQKNYPMDIDDKVHTGLYYQVWNAANFLNEGYYEKLLGQSDAMVLEDKARYRYAASINPGTAALQNLFAHGANTSEWLSQLSSDGFMATYRKLFGDSEKYIIEPLVPANLKQPLLRLPFEDGKRWYFTGGPHGGWASGSAWAAVDFAAVGPGGCTPSPEWEIAAAAGKVVQVEDGRVMINLSGANFQGTGWTLMYMHVGTKGRVQKGAYVFMGDRIGHPSCEGGYSQASHMHVARLYNGQWIPAAGDLPFNMAGWVFKGANVEYDGAMLRNGISKPAINGHNDRLNGIFGEFGPDIMALINASP